MPNKGVREQGRPYMYCDACKRLAPIMVDAFGDIFCMVCTTPIFSKGRPVYLSSIEARLRGLHVP